MLFLQLAIVNVLPTTTITSASVPGTTGAHLIIIIVIPFIIINISIIYQQQEYEKLEIMFRKKVHSLETVVTTVTNS